jgi:hypothetical protein
VEQDREEHHRDPNQEQWTLAGIRVLEIGAAMKDFIPHRCPVPAEDRACQPKERTNSNIKSKDSELKVVGCLLRFG